MIVERKGVDLPLSEHVGKHTRVIRICSWIWM
jgi:hypothetical protein